MTLSVYVRSTFQITEHLGNNPSRPAIMLMCKLYLYLFQRKRGASGESKIRHLYNSDKILNFTIYLLCIRNRNKLLTAFQVSGIHELDHIIQYTCIPYVKHILLYRNAEMSVTNKTKDLTITDLANNSLHLI